MTTNELLTDLQSRGVILRAAGDRLKIDAPAGALSDAAVPELRARKGELLAALATGHLCPRCGSDALKQQSREPACWFCAHCRRWCDGKGGPVVEIETVRPLTAEAASGWVM